MQEKNGLSVYIHWPFCESKCPYCDFNSHVRRRPIDEARFVACFDRELAYQSQMTTQKTVSTVFFGGGTPSLISPETIGRILDAVAKYWSLASNAEITLEANPSSVEAEKFQGYRSAGVNRISIGVQSFDDAALKFLGRLHSAEDALNALRIAKRIFDRCSFDLMYALPGQTPEAWHLALTEALTHVTTHVSIYQLTVEQGTPFAALRDARKLCVPRPEVLRQLYDVTQEACDSRGLYAYEISNHACPGYESQHNLAIWRYGEYAAVGPGAHGRLSSPSKGRIAFSNEPNPETWLNFVERDGHGVLTYDVMSHENEADEFLLMGLRLREGVDPAKYRELCGRPFNIQKIKNLEQDHLITSHSEGRIAVTAEGFPVLDSIVADLAV